MLVNIYEYIKRQNIEDGDKNRTCFKYFDEVPFPSLSPTLYLFAYS